MDVDPSKGLETYIAFVTAVGLTVGGVRRFIIRPIISALDTLSRNTAELSEHTRTLSGMGDDIARIKSELTFNGGRSLKDVIYQLVEKEQKGEPQ